MFNQKRDSGDTSRDLIRGSFERVKDDIFSLSKELNYFKEELISLKNSIKLIEIDLNNLKLSQIEAQQNKQIRKTLDITPTHNPTEEQFYPTDLGGPTHNPTVPSEIGGLKYSFLDTSTGNRGVPTDRQTDQQTDNPTHFYAQHSPKEDSRTLKQHILDATEILNSLDTLRKEVRLKFKAITNQEMLVFSTIYDLEQSYVEGVEYEQIALKLKLSPSSIRDYVQRLISKGVPILKNKVNNKKILLTISQDLKKIATLDTIIKLREL